MVVAVLCFVRHRSEEYVFEKKLREVQKKKKSEQMEVLRADNDLADDPKVR